MPDWKSSAELQKESEVFVKFMHAMLGVYVYEWFISFNFDWQYISRKKRFRWPIGSFTDALTLRLGSAVALDASKYVQCLDKNVAA
ncbi:hypothetical protein H0H92_015799 [Tricholoma furcatifolium]|nr:hypothetical protein H0H92_015799 [Tricholoma furcatifolium]